MLTTAYAHKLVVNKNNNEWQRDTMSYWRNLLKYCSEDMIKQIKTRAL